MSHKKLFEQGKINRREFNELANLKEMSRNPAVDKGKRKELARIYKERERDFSRRGRPEDNLPGHIREAER